MGIQYRYVWIYRLLIPIIHRKSVRSKFEQAVGKNVSVLDVACGFGLMADHLDSSVTYSGIDLNERFIAHAKEHGKNVQLADIFDPDSYAKNDVLVLVDLIHHMPGERLQELFELVFKHAKKKVVILEPSFVNLKSKYGPFGSAVDWAFKKLDSDGVNTIESWYSDAEYRDMFDNRFGSSLGKKFIPTITEVRPYYLVTFERK